MSFKVATWNISGGVSKEVMGDIYFDQAKSKEIDKSFLNKIINIINENNIDIICFQEIITNSELEYIDTIKNNTNLKYSEYYELSECNLVENANCGIAILSKYRILETDKMMFTNPKLAKKTKSGNTYYTYDKGAMNCKIEINGEFVNVITHHGFPFRRFNSTPLENINVYNEFNNFIKKYNNRIVTGDFNNENQDELITELNKLSKINDCVTTVDNMKFDKIYIENKYNANDFKIIHEDSDHYMLLVTINI